MTRRERLETRLERRRDWAASRSAASDAAIGRVHAIADQIPFGQPILVGHHSEGRARADQRRMERGMRATIEHARMADHHQERADGIEQQLRTSIFSDDADAAERLGEKIARLEAERDRLKAYNASCRKGAPDVSLLDDAQRADLESIKRVCPYQLGKHDAMPAYALSNLGANIRRLQQRRQQIARDAERREAGDRGHGKQMSSRYAGTCPDCGQDFDRGASIVWYRTTREAVCTGCAYPAS